MVLRFILGIIVVSFLSFSLSARTNHVNNIGTEIGRYAPPIELEDIYGARISLESMRGSVVLVNFWSTRCSPCMAKMPSLNRLYTTLKDSGLEVVSVAIDEAEEPVREYVAKNNIAFTVLLDTDQQVFFSRYQAPNLPATYLLDRNGVIVEKFSGLAVWDAPEMKNRVLIVLQKK